MRHASSLVLVAAVAAALVGCTAPLTPTDGDIVPQSTVGHDVIAGWQEEDGFLVSPALAAPGGATRVGLIARVDAGADVVFLARGIDDDRWAPAEITWRDNEAADSRDDRFVARVDLAGVARAVLLKVKADDLARLHSLTWEAVVPMPASTTTTAPTTATSTTTQAVLDGYQPRSAWGARAAGGCDGNNTKTKVTVHHTVSRLNAGGTRDQLTAEIRSAQALHMDGRGYCDIGYHFLVTADGTVWEGRNQNHLGAHTGGQNTNNLGVSFVGCFHPTSDCDGLGSTTPPQSMLNGAGAFIGTAARHYGITLNVGTTLLGHRDNAGQSTACPGDLLHDRLPELRTIAGGGGAPVTTTGKVQGAVWNLALAPSVAEATAAGARLPGATVTARRGGAVVATATARADDAYWSVDLDPGSYTLEVALAGFANATRDINVASGDSAWASIGVTPVAAAVAVAVTVVDADTGAPIAGAEVTVTGVDPAVANAEGRFAVSVPPGAITVSARAEGYSSKTTDVTAVVGSALDVTLALTLIVVDPGEGDPGEGDPGVGDPGDDKGMERVLIRNRGTPVVTGGCQSTPSALPAVVLLLPLLAVARRRRIAPL